MIYLLLTAMSDWLVETGLWPYVRVMDQVQFRALVAALIAFAIVVLMGKRVIGFLVRKKVGDTGATDSELLRNVSTSKANTPTMGGILIVGAVFIGTFLLADISQFYVYMGMVVMLWMAALGGIDDWLKLTSRKRGDAGRQGLYAWEKLAFQLGIGLIAGYFVHRQGVGPDDVRHVLNLPFQRTYQGVARELNPDLIFLGPAVFAVIGTLVIAGMSNAANITDGMDGLAAGITTAICLGLVVLGFIAGELNWAQYLLVPHVPGAGELAVVAGALGGACLGFLWWNCSPAHVFMGDTGSLALGGLIGFVAVVLRQEVVVLLMAGVFLAEIASVVMQVACFKLTGGKRIFRCAPYHHHLHLGGWPEPRVVARLWIVSVILVVVGLATLKLR
jgi:phospho-N-acetylmuramoyl-pentapeptide-transferase